MPTRQHRITPADAGQKLHRFARRWLREVPLSAIFRMLRQGHITVNGRRASPHQILRAGDVVEAILSKPEAAATAGQARDSVGPRRDRPEQPASLTRRWPALAVVYEDEDILIVNKPAGLLVHPGSAQVPTSSSPGRGGNADNEDHPGTLLDQVRAYLDRADGGATPGDGAAMGDPPSVYRPSPAHRLDRNTSGLVAFGKTHTGAQRLAAWLRSGDVEKLYVAVVEGQPPAGRLVHGLRRDRNRRRSQVTPWPAGEEPPANSRHGPPVKRAVLDVNPLSTRGGFSLVKIRLLTGRPHQIRAQMAAAGHPLVGDVKYGGRRWAGLHRPALHCYRLVFPAGIEAVAPLPADLTRLCRCLGLDTRQLLTPEGDGRP